MLKWKETITIPANIETVWSLFQIENLQTIMPEVISTVVLEAKKGIVGSTYLQKYKEGNQVISYVVTDLEHTDQPDYKHTTSSFTIMKLINVLVSYTLEAIDDQNTRFTYSGQNTGANIIGKLLLKFTPKKSNQKIVDDFIQRVYDESIKLNK